MQNDTPTAVLARIRAAWASRRSCGLCAVGAGLRVQRIVALEAKGRLAPDVALRMALEAEAMALAFGPLEWEDGL